MLKIFGLGSRHQKAPAKADPSLSDEQIQAEYFPGFAPVAPSIRDIRLEALEPCPDGEHWMVRGADGLEVLISGTSEGPNANHIARARLALSHIEDAASLSIRLLQSFVHESGSWSFDELNVGQDADQNRCEFQTALSFSPSNGSDSYGYTSFVVCFRSFQDSKRTRIHPYKTVIEFL